MFYKKIWFDAYFLRYSKLKKDASVRKSFFSFPGKFSKEFLVKISNGKRNQKFFLGTHMSENDPSPLTHSTPYASKLTSSRQGLLEYCLRGYFSFLNSLLSM